MDQIARPHGTHHYEELISRYRSVRLFLPKLLELPFEGLPAGQIVLGGLAAVRTLEGRRRIGRDEIPGTLVTPTWERSVFVEPDQVERRSFTFCILEQLRGALRRRDVFVSKEPAVFDCTIRRQPLWKLTRPQRLLRLVEKLKLRTVH